MLLRHVQTAAALLAVLGMGSLIRAEDDPLRYARQNPILREYFIMRALESRISMDRFGNRRYLGNLGNLHKQADLLLQEFLKDVGTEIRGLSNLLDAVRTARREWQEGPTGGSAHKLQLLHRWIQSLEELSRSADRLHDLLSFPIGSRIRKADFRAEVREEGLLDGFAEEMRFLEAQVWLAEERLTDYFYHPTHTVSVSQLQGGDMLGHLIQVRETARELGRRAAARQRS